MGSNRRHDCDQCIYIDRPILVVGSRRFSTEVLANYICSNTPAKLGVVERIDEIKTKAADQQDDWRLIFIDCLGLSNAEIVSFLKMDASGLLTSDIVALLNLSSEETGFTELIDIGVRGFFFENDSAELILKGICALKNGELWISRATLLQYASQKPRRVALDEHPAILLTTREREVLHLLSTGLSNNEIAGQLFISNHTVKSHIYKIIRKLKVDNRLQAALWAAKYMQ
ncbi:MAG: hypothetical protein C0623_13185 [Desulfuromonas sp.]|nr:MAG: hypothetical protein C0623_13185 [Desulfuromonas sp.]